MNSCISDQIKRASAAAVYEIRHSLVPTERSLRNIQVRYINHNIPSCFISEDSICIRGRGSPEYAPTRTGSRWRGCGISAHRITGISDVVVRRAGNSQVRESGSHVKGTKNNKKKERETEEKRVKVGEIKWARTRRSRSSLSFSLSLGSVEPAT